MSADVEADALQEWSCAANCLQYENDPGPGPAHVHVGSQTEWVSVSRREALRNAYARRLVLNLDGDHARVAATGRQLDREMTECAELDPQARRC